MKRTRNLVLATVMGATLALAGCGGSDSAGDGDGDAKKGKIGVILPDTKSSVRWESADRPALEKAFKAAGVDYDIQNAEGDADKMATIADGMITDGVTVLAIVNLDSDSGAAIEGRPRSRASRPSTTTASRSVVRLTSTSPTTTRRSAPSRVKVSPSASEKRG